MPRDLGDVLDLFLPGADAQRETHPADPEPMPALPALLARERETDGLPVLTLPMDDSDVLKAALAWNLAIEIARLDAHATVVTRNDPNQSPLWPAPGRGPLGAELIHAQANDATTLTEAATEAAQRRAQESTDGGIVIVCVPPAWIDAHNSASIRWALLFTRSERRELLEAYALTKTLLLRPDRPRVGLTIHGAHSVDRAERAFRQIAEVSHRRLGCSPVSYGLLVDDLHVYRAIVARRPIGLEHPQSPAARALRDVAQLLLSDARKGSLA